MKTRRVLLSKLLVLGCVAALWFVGPPLAPGQLAAREEPVTTWLRRSAVPLASLVPGSGFADLEPLRAELKGVRIVGLGEATHGTREFFQFKHRMVEFLVREMGFTVLALEVQYLKCVPVNDYVLHRTVTSDPAALIRANLSGIYQTEEVLALVEWMRAYNATVPDERRVRFRGFDVQSPHRAADAVVAYLRRVAPEDVPAVEKLMNETAPKDFRRFWLEYGERPAARKSRLRTRLQSLLGSFVAREARFVRLSSRDDYEAALQAARILVQSDEIRSVPDSRKQTEDDARDRNMAETVELLLQRELRGTKIILWAHDAHLWTMQPTGTPAMPPALRAELARHQLLFKPMGRYLRDVFGSEYYAFGFIFDEGSFQAVDAESGDDSVSPLEFTLGPSPAGSLGWQMTRAGIGDFVVGFRGAPTDGPVAEWLDHPQRFRFAGAEFSRKWAESEYSVPTIPRAHFDGLVFVRRTTRARSL